MPVKPTELLKKKKGKANPYDMKHEGHVRFVVRPANYSHGDETTAPISIANDHDEASAREYATRIAEERGADIVVVREEVTFVSRKATAERKLGEMSTSERNHLTFSKLRALYVEDDDECACAVCEFFRNVPL